MALLWCLIVYTARLILVSLIISTNVLVNGNNSYERLNIPTVEFIQSSYPINSQRTRSKPERDQQVEKTKLVVTPPSTTVNRKIAKDDSFGLNFTAFGRTFYLRLAPDTNARHPSAKVILAKENNQIKHIPLESLMQTYSGKSYSSHSHWEQFSMNQGGNPKDVKTNMPSVESARLTLLGDGSQINELHQPTFTSPTFYTYFSQGNEKFQIVPNHFYTIHHDIPLNIIGKFIYYRRAALKFSTMTIFRHEKTPDNLFNQGLIPQMIYNNNSFSTIVSPQTLISSSPKIKEGPSQLVDDIIVSCTKNDQEIHIGVAVDCNYANSFNNVVTDIVTEVMSMWGEVDNAYRTQFRIGIKVVKLYIPLQCGKEKWNQKCSPDYTGNQRLIDFGEWRSQQPSNEALWHLMTDCGMIGALGIAYRDSLCNAPVYSSNSSFSYGVGISSRTRLGWIVLAHELGHNFGANDACTEYKCAATNNTALDSKGNMVCEKCGDGCVCSGNHIMNDFFTESSTRFSKRSMVSICDTIEKKRSGGELKNCLLNVA